MDEERNDGRVIALFADFIITLILANLIEWFTRLFRTYQTTN